MTVDQALALAVALARLRLDYLEEPEPGDLVVEVTAFWRSPDSDAIGWLVAHGEAAYAEDGTGPTRECWDVTPLSGRAMPGRSYQRWENARFVRVPERVVVRCGLERPAGWASDFAGAAVVYG